MVYGPKHVRAEIWVYGPRNGVCTSRDHGPRKQNRMHVHANKIYTRRIATVFNIYRIITRHGRAAIEVSI